MSIPKIILTKIILGIDKVIILKYNTQSCWCGSMAEQLICNQQVVGSTPITSSIMGVFPSGQRGQTVNLLSPTTVVRIHPLPPKKKTSFDRNLSFSVIFALRRVILLRSDICLTTSDIRFASFGGEYHLICSGSNT